MSISDFAIERPIVTVVVMLALVLFGAFALARLDVDEFPDVSNPIVFVTVPYPGASPGQVEREVVERIEEAANAISGIDQITSKSLDGYALITVQFTFGVDPDRAEQDVRDAISGVRSDLPPEMKEPVLKKFDPDDLPIVSLILTSPRLHPPELTLLADPGITRDLRALPGVAQAEVEGNVDRQVSIDVRPADLAAAGLSIADVVAAVGAQNLATPVGAIEGPLTEEAIRLRGRIEEPRDFGQLTVSTRGGQAIPLSTVADVYDGTAEPRSLALFDGQEAVGIDITKAKGYSTAKVADDVKAAVSGIRRRLPPDVHLEVVRDAGVRVSSSVRNVEETLFEGAILTVLVVFLFLNSWRSTVITGLALPVSVLSSFIAVWACGFTLNTMSLLGLSLAIGILIDDAIVVRENIVRHVEMGEDHTKASHTGTNEIAMAVAATTFSIVAVFVPVAFISGLAGQWFKPFALTIACAVLVSLFVSFSLDPMLSAYWPDPQIEAHERRSALSRALDRFNSWFDRMADRYRGVIGWALDHRGLMGVLIVACFLGAIALQVLFGGAGFAPASDRSETVVTIEAPPGSNLAYTRAKAEQVLALLRAHREVAYTYTTIGSSNGTSGVDTGSIYVKLVPKRQRRASQEQIEAALRGEMARVPGVDAYIAGAGFGGAKQIQIQVRGQNGDDLLRAARQIEAIVRGTPGATDVGLSTRGERPELEVDLRRGLAGALGLTVGQVSQSLRPAFAGIKAGDWVDPTGKTRDVTVRLAAAARDRLDDLAKLPLVIAAPAAAGAGAAGAAGAGAGAPQVLPLGQVAEIRRTLGPAEIDHLDRNEVITVAANTQGRPLSAVTGAINRRMARLQLPPGVTLSQGGDVKSEREIFGSILAALALAVLLMYFILVVQFGSFLDPLAILLSLPLSLIGVVLALLLTGDTLNIMSLIGVILLMGIVVKNAILLIDFARWNHERGMPLRESLIEAGRVRLRPILMTTLALIAGMIPVALGLGEGADFRAPLGRAVIGGTITSTLLTLLVIPTVYETLYGWRERLTARFRHRAPAREPAAQAGGG